MKVQIGLSCDPNWLCDGLSWLLAVIVLSVIIGLVAVVIRDRRSPKSGRYPIKFAKDSHKQAKKKHSH